MSENNDYSINLDTKFDYLEVVDVPSLVAANQKKWYNQTLCQVNEGAGIMMIPAPLFYAPERCAKRAPGRRTQAAQ